MRFFVIALTLGALAVTGSAQAMTLNQALQGDQRSAGQTLRDQYRHPKQTLEFFKVKPDMTVVEIWPGAGGWYTAILAPWLRNSGTFYAAQFPPDSGIGFYTRSLKQYRAKLKADPGDYDQVKITYLYPPKHTEIAPPGSADRVLTFRNVHNWAAAGNAQAVFNSFYKALKPGGILGVVDHRAPPGRSFKKQIETGYMTQAYVIGLARQAGFVLDAKSDINANPSDTKDYPDGVWTLPPTLRLGDKNREKYQAIGESDRMTLRFVKPDQAGNHQENH